MIAAFILGSFKTPVLNERRFLPPLPPGTLDSISISAVRAVWERSHQVEAGVQLQTLTMHRAVLLARG